MSYPCDKCQAVLQKGLWSRLSFYNDSTVYSFKTTKTEAIKLRKKTESIKGARFSQEAILRSSECSRQNELSNSV
jgi:hypothetical protein